MASARKTTWYLLVRRTIDGEREMVFARYITGKHTPFAVITGFREKATEFATLKEAHAVARLVRSEKVPAKQRRTVAVVRYTRKEKQRP